jgi:surface polysaccharide O-acyltransferase-like enzyme
MNLYLSNKIKILSFMAIIMVVFLHAYNIDIKQGGTVLYFEKGYNWFIQNYISNGVTRIAVPMFFLISGFLFFFNKGVPHSINFEDKIKKRMKTLLVPYLFWVLFGILFYFLLQSFPQSKSFFTKKLIANYTGLDWLNAIFVNPIPYQFWFIRDLIVITFLSPIFYFLLKKLKLIYIVTIGGFWVFNQDTVFLTSEALLFFSCGAYISIAKPDLIQIRQSNPKWYYLLLFWMLLIGVKTTLLLNDASETAANLIHKLSIIIGLIGIWTVYDTLTNEKVTKTATIFSYSFFIYAFHEPFLTIVKKGLFSVLGKTEVFYFIIYFVAPTLTIFVSSIVAVILKKHLTSLYSVITGNR